MTTNLPNDFPIEITTKLRDGTHKGERQLWAPFAHKGELFKLVISFDRHFTLPRCAPGEEWLIRVHNSPNGHIVFCRLVRQTLTVNGVHPVIEKTAWHLKYKCHMSIERRVDRFSRDISLRMNGILDDIIVVDDVIMIAMTDVTQWVGRNEGKKLGSQTFELPVTATWSEEGEDCKLTAVDERHVLIVVAFGSHSSLEGVDDQYSEDDFDDGAYQDMLERREESYWEDREFFSERDDEY